MSTILIKSWMKTSSLVGGPIWNSQGWSEYDILLVWTNGFSSKHGFCWPLLIEDEEAGRVVEVSRLINQWWAVQAHEIDQAPLFNVAHPTKSSRHGIKPRRKKTDAGKIREIGRRFRWKAEKFKCGKTDAGENQGNCGEIRNWKLSGVAMMENWLATAF